MTQDWRRAWTCQGDLEIYNDFFLGIRQPGNFIMNKTQERMNDTAKLYFNGLTFMG